MSTDLTMSFTVEQTPQQVFDAVNDVRSWWSGNIVGDTSTLGAEWTYSVPDIHFSKLRITELVPAERVSWLVLDSHLTFIEDKEEWTGTTVHFEITEESAEAGDNRRTRLTFTHEGLNAEQECYDVCNTAWGQYILGSLRTLIQAGAGRPDFFSNQESLEAALSGTVETPNVS
ncbi:MAG TPA: SRPBCC domain-containing protein [Intrasporangium sp.]|jgi:hypothetical protein|uniref:SRPBCC family protein n=1 Tax=Intrasporangium sp. TaxID=1925024 RepID=UPI002F9237A4